MNEIENKKNERLADIGDVHLKVMGDPTCFRQVLINFLK